MMYRPIMSDDESKRIELIKQSGHWEELNITGSKERLWRQKQNKEM